jgi:hypothetical protein
MTIFAVFGSRTHSLDFVSQLNKYGVVAQTTTTPKEARIGCGLCVRYDSRYQVKAKAVLSVKRYSSFKGFYKLDYSLGRARVLPY